MKQEYIIGDIVMYDNKIMVIKEPRDGIHFDLSCPEEKLVYCCVGVEDIKPMPLTSEILEKNGFGFTRNSDTKSVWNGWWIYKGLEMATSCLNREGNWPCYINIYDSNIKCEYVHQLQHALRLCKLGDLADNFKIQ